MNAHELYARSLSIFDDVARAVPGDRLAAPTPCADWDARKGRYDDIEQWLVVGDRLMPD